MENELFKSPLLLNTLHQTGSSKYLPPYFPSPFFMTIYVRPPLMANLQATSSFPHQAS